jgi:epoxyqueuosine reductase
LDSTISRSALIKEETRRLGFQDCGISRVEILEEDASRLREWLSKGRHAGMTYMERNLEKRMNPELLVEKARSVISVILNYHSSHQQDDPEAPKISAYAIGKDYHGVIRKKLEQLLQFMKMKMGPLHGFMYTDSSPVFERAWAARSGLGWIGKNTMLISRKYGSFLFLGEIICDMDLACDPPIPDYCGTCTRCLEACPTGALVSPKILDANKCISYQTIEKKGPIDEWMKGRMGNHIFGCDICQDVCPWNQKRTPHKVPEFAPAHDLLSMTRKEWMELDESRYRVLFRGTAVERAGFKGIRRNLDFLLES